MRTLQELQSALSSVEDRILVLSRCPEKAGSLWVGFTAPWYRLFGLRPTFSVEKVSNLVEEIANRRRYRGLGTFDAMMQSLKSTADPLPGLFDAAASELEANVESAERGVHARESLAPGYSLWLSNIAAVLRRLWPLVDDSSTEWERRLAEAVSPFALAQPLLGLDRDSRAERAIGSGKLASIDALIASALSETQSLERRRRLLEAARETLIECNASLDLDVSAVKCRQSAIADDLYAIARLGAAGIRANVKTSHQLGEAHRRGEWARLHAGLVGLEQMALKAGNEGTFAIAHDAIEKIWQGRNRFDVAKAQESSLKSVDEVFGAEAKASLSRGIQVAKADYRSPNASEKIKEIDPGDLDFVRRHVESLDASVYLNGLLSVDGCFDVGGVLLPTRVVEEKRLRRAVNFPTGQLTLEPASSPADVPDAAISDPRTVIPDLATGKLLARRFIRDEVQKTNRSVLLGELRIYLLDGSTSMLTPRSVLRDAILIAELCTMIARLNDARRNVTPTLYFQYFDKEVGPVSEIVTAEQAANAIEGLLTTVRTGGTNIQAALLRSIEQIRIAQSRGMDLARANIVLVTDGESPVDESEIVRALVGLGGLQTGISIIALGQENPSLKRLAAHQKEMGRRVFYQYIDDVTIRKIISGERDGVCLHPPDDGELENCADLLRETIEQIQQSERIHDDVAGSDSFLEQVLGEMGSDTALRAAMKGRLELAKRNDAALARRFERWFPRIAEASTGALNYPDPRTESRLGDVISLVEGVTEVLALMTTEHRELQADALEVFQRSLSDANLSPFEYTELLERFPERFEKPFKKLYETVGLLETGT